MPHQCGCYLHGLMQGAFYTSLGILALAVAVAYSRRFASILLTIRKEKIG